ncbi:Pre-rRNA-processing protein ipi3 [Tulasnella sp. 403]|nr:Pre-rRNA-processing protein ipi3 [Tulasnella sp. 403]
MKVREVVLCSTSPSSASLGSGNVHLYDIQTGLQLATFRQTSAAPNSTAVIESKGNEGGLIICAQSDKAILNVYSFQREQLHLRIVLPEKLACITTDTEGKYCAGGTHTGRIYLWEVSPCVSDAMKKQPIPTSKISSGLLFNSFDAHYRSVTVLRFTRDSAALVSGSEDTRVSVWTMSRLLDNELQREVPTSYCNLTDHTLGVTDIACGVGNFPLCRVVTSGMDNSCKIWDLSTKSLLSTFLFPEPISILTVDPAERSIFAGSSDGSIYQVNLFRQKVDPIGRGAGTAEAVGTLGIETAIRVGYEGPNRGRLISLGQGISSMSISLTGSNLIVGTAGGTISIYDISSYQLIRTINVQQSFLASRSTLPTYDFPSDHLYFVEQRAGSTPGQNLQTRVAELEAELGSLKQNLAKAKGLNDTMWETVVNSVLVSDRTPEASPRRKKRARMTDKA